MTRKIVFALFVLIVIALSVSCTQTQSSPTPQANVPNPASVHCEQNGGKLQIVTAADGSQSGVCTFSDGSKCDEWAYFRGECKPGDSLVKPAPTSASTSSLPNPASVYCEQNGGKLQIVTATDGSQNGVCTFSDGSKCEEWAYFRGECKPGDSLVKPAPTSASTSSLPNPASVHCEQNGGKLQIVTAADGSQSGVCTFPDGSKCDEWAYFRGECGPAK